MDATWLQYYKVTVIKTVVLAKEWTRNQKQMHINTVNWSLTKEQGQYYREKSFQWKVLEHPRVKKKSSLTLFIKTDSKWIIEINIKHKTIKLLENNIGENLHDFEFAMTTYLCGSIGIYGGLFLVSVSLFSNDYI